MIKKFNVDGYVTENHFIWWSIRQQHFVDEITLGDEVYIWRSDGELRFSGGVVARCKVVSLPQQYSIEDDENNYWYEEVADHTYLAAELEVLETDVVTGLNRLELQQDEILSELPILKLRQNTNYLLSEQLGDRLRQAWYGKLELAQEIQRDTYDLPELKPSGRSREYNYYSDELKANVLYEHLINDEKHRWLDVNVLGITSGNTNGRSSANILYYLGMKAAYRGVFEGEELKDVIQILANKGEPYAEATRLLQLLDYSTELEKSIYSDLESVNTGLKFPKNAALKFLTSLILMLKVEELKGLLDFNY